MQNLKKAFGTIVEVSEEECSNSMSVTVLDPTAIETTMLQQHGDRPSKEMTAANKNNDLELAEFPPVETHILKKCKNSNSKLVQIINDFINCTNKVAENSTK